MERAATPSVCPFGRVGRWLRDPWNVVFLVLLVAQVASFWAFRFVPTQDGPAHIDNATIVRTFDDPDRWIYREYYELSREPTPQWFLNVLLGALLALVPPLAAEKVLLSVYALLLPLACRYALRAVRPEAAPLSILALPFVGNWALHMGFYSFCFSLPLFFFVVGYWLKHRDGFTLWRAVSFGVLTAVLYGAHPVGLCAAHIALTTLILWSLGYDFVAMRRAGAVDVRALVRAFVRRALIPFVAFLPTGILMVAFFDGKERLSHEFYSMGGAVLRLGSLAFAVSYSRWEVLATAALSAALGLATLVALARRWRHRSLSAADGLFLAACAVTLAYLFAPNTWIVAADGSRTGGFFKERMTYFPFFTLILWLAAQLEGRGLRRLLPAAGAVCAIVLGGMHAAKYAELNGYLAEFVSGSHLVARDSTIISAALGSAGSLPDKRKLAFHVDPFRHAVSYIAAERGAVALANYEARSGFFPVVYRADRNPYKHLALHTEMEREPPPLDLLLYEARTGGRVDYVVLWGAPPKAVDLEEDPTLRWLVGQLEDGFERIFTSPKTGLMELYRRKEPKLTASHIGQTEPGDSNAEASR